MRIEETKDVAVIRPLAEYRESVSTCANYGLATSVDFALSDIRATLDTLPSALLVCYDGVELVGFTLVMAIANFFGPQTMALVKYWYAIPNKVRAGPAMMREVYEWGRTHGCSHVISSATDLFGGADKVARFYEQLGMKQLERVYIGRLSSGN